MLKIDYYIFKYFLTSKMAVLTKICLMVIHFFTAYFKRRITSSASDSHTVLHTLWDTSGDLVAYMPLEKVSKGPIEKQLKISHNYGFSAFTPCNAI
jgi:hypothetical protein